MRKTRLQAKHLGMTEASLIRRKIELKRQETQILIRQLCQVEHDQTRENAKISTGV